MKSLRGIIRADTPALSPDEFRLTAIRSWPWRLFHVVLIVGAGLGFVLTTGIGHIAVGAFGLLELWITFGGPFAHNRVKLGDQQVMLQEGGRKRTRVVNVVWQFAGGKRDDACVLVDSAPRPIGPPVIAAQASIVVARLLQAGATATVSTVTPVGEKGGGARLVLEAAGWQKIQVITVLRDLFGEGLAETKGWVDSSPCAVGYELSPESAAAAVEKLRAVGATVQIDVVPATAGPIATPAPQWVPTWSSAADTCRLVLESAGEQKIAVIKTLRQAFGVGLLDAKYWADNAPMRIEVDLLHQDGDAAIRALTAVGARASLVAPADRATD